MPRGEILGLNYGFPDTIGLNKELLESSPCSSPLPRSTDKPMRTLLGMDRDPQAAVFIPRSSFSVNKATNGAFAFSVLARFGVTGSPCWG